MSLLMQLPSSALSFLAQGETVAATSGIGLSHYLVVSALAFCLGLTIVIVRRNAIAVLMGIELLINAAGLNFVAFAKFLIKDPVDGQLVTLFIIVMAAAEAALALAIVLNIFSNTNTIDVSEADALKG
jgi:NADH-quinone oxidoreductase subunit K